MANRIIHAEVVGRDAPALQRFFSDAFGWTLDTNNPGGYGMSDVADTGVVFGVGATPDGSAGHVTFYIHVDDIDATIAKVAASGGGVVMPKFSPGPGVSLALVSDPEGHVIGLTE